MNQNRTTEKTDQIARNESTVERQTESRTVDSEKTSDTLRTEIIKFKHIQKDLILGLQEQAAELTRVNEALIKEATERARAAATIRQSEERYRNMADALPVLVWQSGTDKLRTYFNKGWLDFTGRTMEQELGNGWAERVHPDDYQRCLDIYVSAFERREPFVMEYRLRHHSGEYRWVVDRGVPQFNSDAIFLGYIGGAVDAHDRKLAEQALRQSDSQQTQTSEFNQAVMANMGEGLYTLDTRGLVTYINPAAERLFGWSGTELLGRKMHDATHYRYPDGRPFPADKCAGLQVLQGRTVLSNHEDLFIRKDGTFFPVVYSSSPIKSNSAIVGLVVVFRDVSAQKQTEEALRRSRQNLRALAARLHATHEAERSVLAREIHDELSGSLTALKMDLSLLPDRAAEHHDLLLAKIASMSALINRTLAQVHTIVTELRPAVLDKLGLVAAMEWQAREFQERSGIVCEIHLPVEDIPLNHDRATAVFRIFQEALTNIVRHAGASKVIIDLRSEAGHLILEVRDNGKGIEKKAIDAHSSIGLLGMRERALSFNGAIEITALPEGGTLVSVTIPLE